MTSEAVLTKGNCIITQKLNPSEQQENEVIEWYRQMQAILTEGRFPAKIEIVNQYESTVGRRA